MSSSPQAFPPTPAPAVPRVTCSCHSGSPRAWHAILAIPLAMWALGCGEAKTARVAVHPVEGKVLLRGKPLSNAFVIVHPKGAASEGALPVPAARAQTDANGVFVLSTYEHGDGAAVGEYAVTVQHYPLVKTGESYAAGPNDLPPRLATPQSTDIFVTVAEGKNTLPPIDIRR